MRTPSALLCTLLALACPATAPRAAELTIFTSMGSVSGVRDLAEGFERASGHKVTVGFRVGAALPKAIDSDEPGDLIANFAAAVDGLVKRGKVVAGTPVAFTRAGVGVAVKAGAPKPDIATVDAFKRAMLAAKSIGYSKTGSGLIAERALEKLGILAEVKDRVRYLEGTPVAEFIAKGEVEIGMQQINALLPVKGADLVGPLPGELQEYLTFAVGLLTISKQPDAARALIAFMTSPAAEPLLRKSGMEPAR